MKKIILLAVFVLCAAPLATAQDSLMDMATSPVSSAPVVKQEPVKKPVTEVAKEAPTEKVVPKKEEMKKEPPKKKQKPKKKEPKKVKTQSMTRTKDELGKGSMIREKKEDKPKKEKSKTVKHYAPVLSDAECQYLTAYQPGVDGDAEYKPGVDAAGNPVAAADMSPSVIQPPEKIEFNLTVDMAKYAGITAPTGLEGQANVGKVSVENGQIKFNGKPLESEQEAKLKAFCADKAK